MIYYDIYFHDTHYECNVYYYEIYNIKICYEILN